jgi:hypothetical protein
MLKSTGLVDYQNITGSFKAAMDNFTIKVYSGTVPTTADDSIGAAVLLAEFFKDNDGSTRLTWAATSTDGTIERTVAEVAGCTPVATGTASFFRAVLSSDTGALSTTQRRLQGTVKTGGGDMTVASLTFTIAVVRTLGSFFHTELKIGV